MAHVRSPTGDNDRHADAVGTLVTHPPHLRTRRYVLLDVDGTLIDNAYEHAVVWKAWATAMGLDAEEVALSAVGRQPIDTFRSLLPHVNTSTCLAELHRLEDERGHTFGPAPARPGAKELLQGLPEGSAALVTSNFAARVRCRFTRLGLRLPNIIVSAELDLPGKPEPDPYLAAAQLLKAAPQDCLVIEDTPAGITSALAAGMTVWGVHERSQSEPPAHRSYPDLPSLRDDVHDWLRA